MSRGPIRKFLKVGRPLEPRSRPPRRRVPHIDPVDRLMCEIYSVGPMDAGRLFFVRCAGHLSVRDVMNHYPGIVRRIGGGAQVKEGLECKAYGVLAWVARKFFSNGTYAAGDPLAEVSRKR